MIDLIRRVFSFGSLPIIASISPLLVLPLIARASDPQVWTSLLAAQAVGSFGATVVMFGWNASGQARIAQTTDPLVRLGIYSESLRARGLLALLIAPGACGITIAITPSEAWPLSALMCFSTTTLGFSFAWYSVGTGRARAIALYEALPRLAGSLLTALIIASTGAIWVYPAGVLVINLVSLTLFNLRSFGSLIPTSAANVGVFRSLASDWRVALSSISGSLYSSAPLPIVVAVGGSLSAGTASMDRLYRYGLLAFTAFSSGTHAWTLAPDEDQRRRQGLVLLIHVAAGVIGGCVIALLGPLATGLLFGHALAADPLIAALYGLTFATLAVTTTLVQNLLIPHGRTGWTVLATLVAMSVGIPGMIAAGTAYGAAGVIASLAASELLCLLVLVRPSLEVMRELPRAEG